MSLSFRFMVPLKMICEPLAKVASRRLTPIVLPTMSPRVALTSRPAVSDVATGTRKMVDDPDNQPNSAMPPMWPLTCSIKVGSTRMPSC